MDNFNFYAKYYDLLYREKDYEREVEYVCELIQKYAEDEINDILDFGCGTGKHAEVFSRRGFNVDGVDLSSQMVQLARKNYPDIESLRFYEGDITSFTNEQKYDLVTSLFHVVSYQNSNQELLSTFKNANKHLKRNGLFIFDFWYGPGVLSDRPTNRSKVLEDSDIQIRRKAVPVMKSRENVVEVNYSIDVFIQGEKQDQQILESHSMRYLFKPELDHLLKECGFETLGFYKWLSHDEPEMDTWNAVIVAKKV